MAREVVVVARRDRDLDEAVSESLEVDPDRSHLLGLLRLVGIGLRVLAVLPAVGLLLVLRGVVLLLVRLRVGVAAGREGKGAVRLQGDDAGERRLVDDEARLEAVEERVDVPVGEEVEVLSLRVPGGREGVDHRVGHDVDFFSWPSQIRTWLN